MHQDEACVVPGCQAQKPGVQADRTDVVNDIGAVVEGGLGHLEFHRVHGDQGLAGFPQAGDYGDDAADLFFGRHWVGAGP